eukprot:TRINITY_DN7700_c0_g2_i1.p1 TRINITY_DN7700_c0_g2~~TRINITY_DN7700_c0_g2_i1.p1  ORF type:complete len:657 (+),score=107.57 TRINITY_DN7700_c0_g2_i1:71-2041(+)
MNSKPTNMCFDVNSKPFAFGVDAGTTKTCIAYAIENDGEVEYGTIEPYPSVVLVVSKEEIYVGEEARAKRKGCSPKQYIYEVKRLIGKKYEECVKEKLLDKFPYKCIERKSVGKGGNGVQIEIPLKSGNLYFTPEEIVSKIVEYGKNRIMDLFNMNKELRYPCAACVPTNFFAARAKATEQAMRLANLQCFAAIDEPIAAILEISQSITKETSSYICYCVYDLGGGTFDVSLIQGSDTGPRVVDREADPNLGGCNFNEYLMEHFRKVALGHGITNENFENAKPELLDECEKAKIILSDQDYDHNFLFKFGEGDKAQNIDFSIGRRMFEMLIKKKVDETIAAVRKCKNKLEGKRTDVKIVPIGGSSKIPLIRRKLSDEFGTSFEELKTAQLDRMVALGACRYCVRNHHGCAVQAEKSDKGTFRLRNYAPMNIGLEVVREIGGVTTTICRPMIKRNEGLPQDEWDIFGPERPGQTAVAIKIYEGMSDEIEHNKVLGIVRLDLLYDKDLNPQVKVLFRMDSYGSLKVKVVQVGSKTSNQKEKTLRIENQNLSEEEILAMIEENNKHSEINHLKRQARQTLRNMNGDICHLWGCVDDIRNPDASSHAIKKILEFEQWAKTATNLKKIPTEAEMWTKLENTKVEIRQILLKEMSKNMKASK